MKSILALAVLLLTYPFSNLPLEFSEPVIPGMDNPEVAWLNYAALDSLSLPTMITWNIIVAISER